MQMKGRIVVLALAIAFIAAPTLGVVAMDGCPPCCHQPADEDCKTGAAPCVSMASTSCCDVAPAAPAPQPFRSTDSPTLGWISAAVSLGAPVPRRADTPRVTETMAPLTSPLRLSVVLLI